LDRSYRPQGYSSVSAYVVADGAQDVIDFLIESFDARQTRRYDMPDGSIVHAEVLIDDTVVMIADGGEQNPGRCSLPRPDRKPGPDADDAPLTPAGRGRGHGNLLSLREGCRYHRHVRQRHQRDVF
jgi:hypothetical protein